MPYADPDKARECYRLAQIKYRNKRAAEGNPVKGNSPEYMAAYYDANREKIVERSSERNKKLGNNRLTSEQKRAQTQKRRALKKGSKGSSYTASDLVRIMDEQGHVCTYCPADLRCVEYHADHKTPLSRGGSNAADNMQMLCATCNMRKHARTHEEFLARLEREADAKSRPDNIIAQTIEHLLLGLAA